MSRSLADFLNAVETDLGESVASTFPAGFFERAVNEGQARLEPEITKRSVVTGVTIAEDSTTYALPSDAIDRPPRFQASIDTSSPDLSSVTVIGGVCYFARPVTRAWTGIVFYEAHYPAVTDTQACLLPTAAADGVVSFVLYRAFRRIAAGRAEYYAYATMVGNAVAMADLEQAASIHNQDFEEARVSAYIVPAASTAFDE